MNGAEPSGGWRVLVAAAALMAMSTGCTQTTGGTPHPSGGVGPTGTSPSADGGNPLRNLDPCALLTPDEVRQLGGSGPAKPEDLTTSRGCGWRGPDTSSFGIAFFETLGIDDLTITGRRVPVTINGRRAERVEEERVFSSCSVIFPVTDSSVAQSDVVADDMATACRLAEQVAQIIAPKLP